MPPQLFRLPRPFPAPLKSSPPLGPAWMPPPPAAVKKMRLRPLPYAVNRTWGMAMIGFQIVTCIAMPLSIWLFDSVPEEARIWIWLYLCLAAAMVVITCVNVCYHPQQLATEEAVLLPPPPPEMDMC